MSIFDNMLQLNNSFLLIALIIIAIICIYLLYSNLTKSGETASLKSGINALIQQNKKRDEIINFLLERVENLEHNVGPAQLQGSTVQQGQNVVAPVVVNDDIDDVLGASATIMTTDIASSLEVDDILDSIHRDETTESALPTVEVTESPLPDVIIESPFVETTESSLPIVVETTTEFPELESEFEGLLTNTTEMHVDELATSSTTAPDLVSSLLDADEESVSGDHEIDLSSVPKNKDKLNAQYTVKQLKALSRQLKLKSKGNKTELINRIYDKI
jgi:hypothetical protein